MHKISFIPPLIFEPDGDKAQPCKKETSCFSNGDNARARLEFRRES